MFSFGRDARYRLESHRHNPYIGSFHTVDLQTKSSSSSMLLDSSLKNPFIGTRRHSPAVSSVGFKGILWEEEPWKAPVTSQVRLSREKRYSNRHASTTLLASIPITRFKHTDAVLPVCGICLETFSDGDELRPLPCLHCFHRACVDEWLLGLKSDEMTFTNNCPCCRRDISPVTNPLMSLSTFSCPIIDEDVLSCTSCSTPNASCAIPRESFERLGRYLSASDIGTSNTLSERFNDEESNIGSDEDNEEMQEIHEYQDDSEDNNDNRDHHDNHDNQEFPHININIATLSLEDESYTDEGLELNSERNSERDCERNTDSNADRDLPEESREDSCFYDISLSDDDAVSLSLSVSADSQENEDDVRNSFSRRNIAETFYGKESEDDEESESESACDNEENDENEDNDVLRASRLSNLSICTATNKLDSNRRREIRRNILEGDGEGGEGGEGCVSDMEEEYFMSSSASSPVNSEGLGGSLYSDCGVPLRAVPGSPSRWSK